MKKIRITALLLALCMIFSCAMAEEYASLQKGSKGSAVKQLQQALIDQGFLSGSADGVYGNGTAGGVSKFQESVGLEATGIADNETQRHLYGDAELDNIEVKFTGVSETNRMRLDGLFVDDSHDSNGKEASLYLFYTLYTDAQNYTANTNTVTIKVNGVNSYTSSHSKGKCDYMRSYSYGNDYTTINFGDEVKVVETFLLPAAELAPGRTLTFTGDENVGMNTISVMTDDIIHFKNADVIAKFIDPAGYAEAKERFAPADSSASKKVKSELTNYYYDFWTTLGTISISGRFTFSGNKYTLTTSLAGKTGGTYEILNNYIRITNGSTGQVDYMEYSWKDNGRLNLDSTAIFDVASFRN